MLVDLELQKVSNYAITTKIHEVVYITLIKQFISKTVSNNKTNTKSQQLLNFSQEKVLLGYI